MLTERELPSVIAWSVTVRLDAVRDETILAVPDIAPKLGLTVKQAWKQVHAGRIPVALRIKDRPRFRISDINRLVAERAATTTAAVAPDAIAERGDYEWCSE